MQKIDVCPNIKKKNNAMTGFIGGLEHTSSQLAGKI